MTGAPGHDLPVARLRIWVGAACFSAACGGASNPPRPGIIATREMPPPVLSRFEQPRAVIATPARPAINRDSVSGPPPPPPPPLPSAQTQPKPDEVSSPRESLVQPTPKPPSPTATLPDDVVIGLLETGRAAFVRCFKKAIAADPTELSFKVKLHVELDAAGAITASRTDSANKDLDTCLVRMAAWLKYPVSDKGVVVELPLIYQGSY
jgi:hypothetical protein